MNKFVKKLTFISFLIGAIVVSNSLLAQENIEQSPKLEEVTQEKTGIPEIDSAITEVEVDDFYTDLMSEIGQEPEELNLDEYDNPLSKERIEEIKNPKEQLEKEEKVEKQETKQAQPQPEKQAAPVRKKTWAEIIKEKKKKQEARTNMFRKAYSKRLKRGSSSSQDDEDDEDSEDDEDGQDNEDGNGENKKDEKQKSKKEKEEEEEPINVTVSGIAQGGASSSISLELKGDYEQLGWEKGDKKSISLDSSVDTDLDIRKGTGVVVGVRKKGDKITGTSLSISAATKSRRRSRQSDAADRLCAAGKHPMQSTYCK